MVRPGKRGVFLGISVLSMNFKSKPLREERTAHVSLAMQRAMSHRCSPSSSVLQEFGAIPGFGISPHRVGFEWRTLSQHSQAAAARSWFKPPPNQDSTFISCCHYSPAAPWQMALWDIGFYGRSSFISNFFSHLMRSSRSSQIQFAVWILIGLCTPSIFHLLVRSLCLCPRLRRVSTGLMAFCTRCSICDAASVMGSVHPWRKNE